MSPKACVALKDEELYILEIFIDSVSLNAEKLDKIDPSTLGVDLKFIDFPLFRIFQSQFLLTKPDRGREMTRDSGYRIVHFNAGKMYLFTKNPGELTDKMRTTPMLLDVYKIKDILICPEEVLKDSLGEAKIPMAGCLCNQVMMASNDIYHLPKPYEIRNTFGLVDIERRPSGFITLFIRLTCFGKSVSNPFSLVQKKLLFRNTGSFNEFLCTKVLYPDEDERRAAEEGKKFCLPHQVFEESELDAPPRPFNIAGLILICRELAKRDGYPTEIVPPNYPPKIPVTNVEEKKFGKDRRSEESGDARSAHSNILERKFYLYQRDCISTGCGGNICTGVK